MKKVLIVAAHPDDEIFGMGGTICALCEQGAEVSLLIVTDGSSSQYRDDPRLDEIIAAKKEETKKAAEIVGIKEVIYGGLRDMRLDSTEHIEVNAVIEKAVAKIKPDTVFTHFWGDVNFDHKCVYNSTLVATRPTAWQCVKSLYCYSVASSTEWSPSSNPTQFMPNVFFDISRYADKKAAAIAAYKTELRDFPHPRSAEYVKKLDEAAGLRVGVASAEEFMLVRAVI